MDSKRNAAPVVLQLLISGQKIKEMPVDFNGTEVLEARKILVNNYYSHVIMSSVRRYDLIDLPASPDWELWLVCQSKMNNPIDKKTLQ